MELLHYLTESGTDIFLEWLRRVSDVRTRAKISQRVNRLLADNFGDCKPIHQGVWELRIDWGPGYRVYYARVGSAMLLLLCGGLKRTQPQDIQRAINYLKGYYRRTELP
jgi:putative addiction module killer protein